MFWAPLVKLRSFSTEQPYQFGQGMLNAWTIYAGPMLAAFSSSRIPLLTLTSSCSERMGEGMGREMAWLTISGTGSGQPLGIITALNAKGAVSLAAAILP